MKILNKSIIAMASLFGLALTSCENGDWEFDNFEYTTTYFAYQSPVRTITFGEDFTVDNSLDNEGKCQIMATMGGVYSNNKNVVIDFKVDNTLVDGFQYKENGQNIIAMPSNYYELESNQIIIPKGKVIGGVTVKLTDAFFNDPMATKLNYVIPVVMTKVTGVDSILVGKAQDGVTSPNRLVSDDWAVAPKDYTLYAIKYISKYQANYLRRGVDVYSGAMTGTTKRHAQYVEKDEVVEKQFSTLGRNTVEWARPTKNADKTDVNCRLKLSFDAEGNCTVTSNNNEVAASGTGKFIAKGDKKSWGGKDRDMLVLDYTLQYNGVTCASKDTLVVRDRGVAAEFFTVVK